MRIFTNRLLAAMTAMGTLQASAQQGNPVPVPTAEVPRMTSSTNTYEKEAKFKEKYDSEAEKRRALEEEIQRIRGGFKSDSTPAIAPETTVPSVPTVSNTVRKNTPTTKKKVAAKRNSINNGMTTTDVFSPFAPITNAMPLVFSVSAPSLSKELSTVVPLGSYVKSRVLTGVEANTLEPYPMLLQLDYAFVGPNKTRVDLSHCFMIAKTKANLSTERVMGETQEISCVRQNGEHFKRAAKGYLAGEDSTFGLTGELISKQGQVLLASVLANLAKGAGEAVALANSTTQTVTGIGGAVEKSTAVTGNAAAFVAGKATMDSASLIANWYLDYAKQLVPSIAVGSGRDIWIVLLDTIHVPSLPADME